MKNCLLTYSIFASILFFSITSIVGITYLGGESNNLYLYASVLSFVYSICITTPFFVKRYNTVPHMLGTIAIIVAIYLLGSIEGYTRSRTLNIFTAFSLPNIIIGTYLGSQSGLKKIIKWLDITMLIITLGLIFSLNDFLTAMYLGEKGYSQDKSYFASLAFLLNLFLLQFGHRFERFTFTSNKYYTWLCMVLLPIQVVLLLISGGRGGFVALVVGVLVFFYCIRKTKDTSPKRFLWATFGSIIVASLIGSFVSPVFLDLLENSINRVFSYVSSSGIDMTQTSHRDEVYQAALQKISENPIAGYGFFSYSKELGEWPYPHNLFLEWLLQGGIFFFVFCFVILVRQIKKLFRYITVDNSLLMLVVLLFYSLTELMFSATYICMSLFWFCLFYLINYKYIPER